MMGTLQRPPLLDEAYSAEHFRHQGHELVDLLADYLARAQQGLLPQTLPWQEPESSLAYWQSYLPSADWSQLVKDTLANSVCLHDPRFVGHQINPPVPIAALASLVVDLTNNGMGVYEMGMAGTAMEQVLLRLLTDHLDMPHAAGGFLTSGGSLANLTALLAARARLTDDQVWQRGTSRPLVVLVSEAAHYCVDRAARIMGLGESGICRVPVDANYQMRVECLPELLRSVQDRGAHAFALVANAGSTATGSFDPLEPLADFCRKNQLWLHVDGAHGAAVCFSRRFRHLIRGIQHADSVTLDFHKLLMTPAITSALVFRQTRDSYRTFVQQADYLFADSSELEWYNLARRTFECTKHMMGFKVFAIVQQYGTSLWEMHLDYLFDLAQAFAEMIRARPDFQLALPPQANIVCFRWCPPQVPRHALGSFTAKLREQVIQRGAYYLVQTNLEGGPWLRTTLSNPRTTTTELQGLLDAIEQVGQALVAAGC